MKCSILGPVLSLPGQKVSKYFTIRMILNQTKRRKENILIDSYQPIRKKMEEAPSLNAFKNPSALFATPWVFCYRGYKKNCRAGGNQHLSLNCFKPSFICICTCINKPSISKAGSSVKQGLRVGESHFQSV